MGRTGPDGVDWAEGGEWGGLDRGGQMGWTGKPRADVAADWADWAGWGGVGGGR